MAKNKWMKQYDIVANFYKENGHYVIPKDYTVDGFNIYSWTNNQRRFHNRGELELERIQLLNRIDFPWNMHEYSWLRCFYKCKEFYDKHHNYKMPDSYMIDDVILNKWLHSQISMYRAGKMEETKSILLRMINVQLDTVNTWEIYYPLAQKYYEENGHLIVPRSYMKKGLALGKWIARLRQNKDKLSNEQIKDLENIGMVWNVLDYKRSSWDEVYELAKEYYKEHGNLLVSRYEIYKGYPLGNWVSKQKYFFKTGQLSNDRIKKLTNLKIYFGVNGRWISYYLIAKKYYENYGNLDVPSSYIYDGIDLGSWFAQQRCRRNKEKLSNDQIELLDDIGMIWDLRRYYLVHNKIRKMKSCRHQLEVILLETLVNYPKDYKFVDSNSVKMIEEDYTRKLYRW